MPSLNDRLLAALQLLLRASHLASPDDLPGLVTRAGMALGARDAIAYVVDYDQVLLVPLTLAVGTSAPETVAIEGTLAGRAYSNVEQQVSTAGGGPLLWVPLLDGTHRVGLLQLDFPEGTPVDDALRAACNDLATLVAELVLARTQYGDAIEAARRRSGMSVPAELQWQLLPPLTFVAPRVTVAGVLAPTAEVAGDSFDYAVNGETTWVALVDAMGHGMEATLLSAVAMATLRNARRRGVDLVGSLRLVDTEIATHFGEDKFVTGIIGELNASTGWWHWGSFGHPPALLVRGGQVVKELDGGVNPPLGLGLLDGEPERGRERLEPGDRLVLYTDGVVEARDSTGEFFGTERLVEYVTREAASGRPVAETLRRLNHAILRHQAGNLQDDATTLIVEWLSAVEPERSVP